MSTTGVPGESPPHVPNEIERSLAKVKKVPHHDANQDTVTCNLHVYHQRIGKQPVGMQSQFCFNSFFQGKQAWFRELTIQPGQWQPLDTGFLIGCGGLIVIEHARPIRPSINVEPREHDPVLYLTFAPLTESVMMIREGACAMFEAVNAERINLSSGNFPQIEANIYLMPK